MSRGASRRRWAQISCDMSVGCAAELVETWRRLLHLEEVIDLVAVLKDTGADNALALLGVPALGAGLDKHLVPPGEEEVAADEAEPGGEEVLLVGEHGEQLLLGDVARVADLVGVEVGGDVEGREEDVVDWRGVSGSLSQRSQVTC